MNSHPASPEAPPLARIIPRDSHPISRRQISPNALRVLYRLKDAGFQAFLVGGCVRDLILGIEPKDFDVATDALPEQVRRLFRNCRLVGRRFRLAHVFYGYEIIEVATFRASSAPDVGDEPLGDAEDEDGEAAELDDADVDGNVDSDANNEPDGNSDDSVDRVLDTHGRILRDNIYGSIDEDIWRRDFTANALYYNIADFSVWDYCGGMEDVAARRLRLIGDPETRYREDPVRMLRAARFEAKLNFKLDPASAAPVAELRHLMGGVPAARLFDETLKLFLLGHGLRGFDILMSYELLDVVLPTVAAYLRRHPGSAVEALLRRGLANTDERVQQDKSVTPSFLFAVLLYGPIAEIIEAMPPQRWHEPGAILDAVDAAVRGLLPRIAIPRRFSLGIRDMFAMQPRLEAPRGRRALRLLENPRFRAAYDLMKLRAEFGLANAQTAAWWTRLQEVSPEERGRMADATAQRSHGGGPSRAGGSSAADSSGGSGGPAAGAAGAAAAGASAAGATGRANDAAPRRRRGPRRRRAPAPGGSAPGGSTPGS